jgi:methionine-S-sulfoxide reductase
MTEIATLGGGCFWCLEAVYRETEGVEKVVSGYMGGSTPNPSYKDVCSGATGHVEVVQLTFDPNVISYRDILGIFFAIHDPTTLNRQGNDVGTQYRSAIFPQTPEQKQIAERVIARVQASGKWKRPVTTSIEPASTWYSAEAYHQDYLRKNPGGYTCHFLRD